MGLGEAFLTYGVKLIVYSVVAGVGIWAGIKIRKSKNAKSTDGK